MRFRPAPPDERPFSYNASTHLERMGAFEMCEARATNRRKCRTNSAKILAFPCIFPCVPHGIVRSSALAFEVTRLSLLRSAWPTFLVLSARILAWRRPFPSRRLVRLLLRHLVVSERLRCVRAPYHRCLVCDTASDRQFCNASPVPNVAFLLRSSLRLREGCQTGVRFDTTSWLLFGCIRLLLHLPPTSVPRATRLGRAHVRDVARPSCRTCASTSSATVCGPRHWDSTLRRRYSLRSSSTRCESRNQVSTIDGPSHRVEDRK